MIPSTQEARVKGSLEFQASLVDIVSSRTARDIFRDPVSKKKERNKQKKYKILLYRRPVPFHRL